MAVKNYTRDRTALLFVDPYNDFLRDGVPRRSLRAGRHHYTQLEFP